MLLTDPAWFFCYLVGVLAQEYIVKYGQGWRT